MWASASDWALRRLLKVLLKRNLKHVLATEIDVEQLRVSLGTGALELSDVLISPEWLAEHAPPGLEVVSGYIGRLVLELAVTSLTCAVQLTDVLLTVRPSGGGGSAPAPSAAAQDQPASEGGSAGGAAGLGGFGIDDGVRLVAAGVETLLQRMTVSISGLSIRVEVAPGSTAASLSCAQVTYGAVELDQQDCHAASTARRIVFSALSLAALEGGPPLVAPLGGQIDIAVRWPLEQRPGHQPHVSVAAMLDPVVAQLRPPDVTSLLTMGRSFAAAWEQSEQAACSAPPAALPVLQQHLQQHHQQGQSSSLIEDLMLPGCEGLVQEALLESAASITGQEEVDEFFDAKSLLGSLQQAFSSAMASSYHSTAASACGAGGGSIAGAGADDVDIFAMHDLAASIREVGGVQGKQWTASLLITSVTLSLMYPVGAGWAAAGASSGQHYAPRLVTEMLDLAVQFDDAAGNGATSSSGISSSLCLTVGLLEIAEHLPFPNSSPSSSSASYGGAGWVPAEEMSRVPALLPLSSHINWPTPTFAGDYPLPDQADSLGIGDTLAQLSDLSQATVYHSATVLENSLMQQSMLCQDAAAVPRVQIVPVLRCSGQTGAALVLHCCSLAAVQGLGQEAAAGVDVTLLLQPVSIWCTLPLLAHLQSFAAPVASELQPANGAAPSMQPNNASSGKAAVAAAISDILEQKPSGSSARPEQKQLAQPPGCPPCSRLSVYLPCACIVLAVPGLDPALPKYFAADVQGSSSQMLASMASRMGSQQPQALMSSLHETGVQPTLVLQHGGRTRAGEEQPCAWTCAVHTGAAALHAVREAGAQQGLGDSVLGPALATAQVASIAGGSKTTRGGLGIDACWQQPAGAPPDMNALWGPAKLEPGCQPELSALREQLSVSSRLLVSVSSGAEVVLELEQGVLAAAGRLADGLLLLSAAPPPVDAAPQATLLLDCDVQCTLSLPQGAPICLAARSVRAVACSSIGGVAGSNAVAMTVGSTELTWSGSDGSTHLLSHAAGQQQADGRRRPAVQVFALLRPTGEPCLLCSNGRYVLPSRGRVSIATAGLTALLDDSGQLEWLTDLQSLSASAATSNNMLGHAPATSSASAVLPPTAVLDWAVRLASCSLRYEPRDTSLTAAVLTVGTISWQAAHGQQHSAMEAQRLVLHVAAANSSPSSGSRSRPTGRLTGLAVSAADLPGFHQVAAEAGIAVRLLGGQQSVQRQAEQAAQQAVRQVAVSNKGLSITLSRHTLLLLQSLVRQLPARSSSGGGSSMQDAAASSNAASPGLECSASSLAASTNSASSEGRRGAPVNVMQGIVQSAYVSPRRQAEHPLEASVFLDGGWYDPQQQQGAAEGARSFVMSPPGSPPAIVEKFMAGRTGAAEEGQGMWYGEEAVLQEEYAALQAPTEEETASSFGSPGYDCRALPPDHPQPTRRISLQDISMTITLADTFATVLLPEDAGEESLLELPGSLQQRSSGSGARAAAGQAAADEEELVPVSAQVQARLEGVCLQLDSFAAHEGGSTQMRCALLVRHLEVRDSFQLRQGGGSGAGAAATGWSDLRRMLGYHASVHRMRGAKACMLQVAVEGIRSELCAEVEYRVQVQLLPLLLHIDQAALAFLQHFFAPAGESSVVASSNCSAQVDASSGASPQPTGLEMFFQRCEVQPFTLTINYCPHRVDLAALTSGQFAEVLNLVPWGGVSLQFRHLRLFGMQGVAGLGTAVASAYVEDIARFQAHRFVGGIAPIKAICRVSSAAAQLLAIPKQQLYKRSSGGGSGGLSLAALADEDFRRQMQRGLAGFVRAVALEALNLGATVAAGAEVALAGESSASHTAGFKQALRQASAQLRSTSGPRTAASSAATAMRTALLGVRNTLDKEHALERRLNS